MKKLLVLALAVVLTLSLAVVASAATFDPYVGGEFQLVYSADAYGDDTPLGPLAGDANGARFKSYVTGRVEDKDTGTWAKIGCLFKTWNNTNNIAVDPTLIDTDNDGTGDAPGVTVDRSQIIFEAGIKATENLSVWYTNDENNDADRGQVPLNQSFFKFGGDPVFDKGPGNVFGVKYASDKFDGAVIYGPNKEGTDNENPVLAAATFKFDGGNVWVAFDDATNGMTQTAVGMAYKFGFGTLKVDYSVWSWDVAGVDDQTTIQASLDLMEDKLNVTVLSDDGKLFADGGLGFGLTYNINDKLYVGGRSISPSEDAGKTSGNNQQVFYLGFKYGIFDSRIGSATVADGDGMFFVTTHVGMW